MCRRFMVISGVVILLTLAAPAPFAQMPASVACRHDSGELPADRVRREQALALGKAINAAEGALAQRTRRYHALAELGSLPPLPDGFELRFYSDGNGYLFSLKDTRDVCRYAIFSDQAGLLYEKTGHAVPLNAQ